jgi:P4 family phage/plasmid primase-like protien
VSSYSDAAQHYLDAGWTGVLPVPVETKFPPPSGYTGGPGADTDQDVVTGWIAERGDSSIALRMPEGVIGIDVDHYDKISKTGNVVAKRGGDTLAEFEKLWGPLPDTWRSSARELPSGIRFFRVPVGQKFATVLGDAIEIIQRHHRYAVVSPSAHTETGGQYGWSHPDYTLEIDEFPVPTVAELPMLPERWIAGLSEHVNQSRTAPAGSAAAQTMITAIEADSRTMCSMMEIATNRAVAQINAAASGSRHDAAMARTMRIIALAAEGHAGGSAALTRARESWDTVTAGEHREYEWDSLVAGAAAMAAGATGLSEPRQLDPCEGAAGAGLEVLTDPGETKRRAVLIVEGLDDARMCSEYAGDETLVIGLAGRESWRKDGVPDAELRMVSGLPVTVLFGPDVTLDFVTWRAAEDLGSTCEAKGARGVIFSQPPGVSGARVSAYLNSLTEAERTAELAHMMTTGGTTPGKPKPKERRRLGAEDTDELPPTDDTSLGTQWADEHINDYRVVSTDKDWLAYRDGRWSADGAELAVAHALMEYLSEASGPLHMVKKKARDPEEKDKYQRAIDILLSTRKRQAVASVAMSYAPMHVRREQLDQYPAIWCAANATINLSTGEVYGHDPALMLTVGSPVHYDPAAGCPRFDQFMVDILPNAEVRGYVLRLFAMAMLGSVVEQIFPVFIGRGRNGKGALIRIMRAIFGEMATVVDPRSLMVNRFEKHEEEIARLRGKRLATVEEPTKGARWNASRIKGWTGGDPLTGSFKGRNTFDFEPSHTLIMASNERPNVEVGEDGSFWERYKEIPFTQSFAGREDYAMEPHILTHELPGVLNRLLEAATSYRADGLREPHAVSGATAETRGSADPFPEMIGDLWERTPNRKEYLSVTDVYHDAAKWWADNGVEQRLPPQARGMFNEAFAEALGVDHNDPAVMGRIGKERTRVWFGLRKRSDSGHLLTPTSTSSEPVRIQGVTDQLRNATLPGTQKDRNNAPEDQIDRSTSDICPPANPLVEIPKRSERPERPDIWGEEELKGEEVVVSSDQLANTHSPDAVAGSGSCVPVVPTAPTAEHVECGGCSRSISAAGAARHNGLCGVCSKIHNI